MVHTDISTNDLTGHALDYAVALAQGIRPSMFIFKQTGQLASEHRYSTDWSLGGPLIEREGITTIRCSDDFKGADRWCAATGQHTIERTTQHQQHDDMYQVYAGDVTYGHTALIAAMRCFVGSKLGNHVDVPKELLS